MHLMRILSLVLCLIVALCSVAQAGPAPIMGSIVPEAVGVNIHFKEAKPGEMEMLAAGGFHWVRIDMLWNQSWSSTERVKGVYNFSAYDHLMADLQQHGIRAICILAYANPLYDGGLSPHTDTGRQAYAAWAVAAAKHFSGRGILWEIWNEPNGRLFWKPAPNAEDYAKLVLAVGKAFRESVPNEMLVGPALSKMDWPFIETCFKAGDLEYLSAVTVHPYRDSDPETVSTDYRKLREMIDRYAPPGKDIPIISSEWGYFLHLNATTTPERQGKLLARQWLTNVANDIPVSIWYDWKDDGTDPKNVEFHFGTVGFEYVKDRQPVYEPKPGYLAAQTLTTVLAGYRFNKPLLLGSDTDHVLLFNKDGDVRLAAWTQDKPHDLLIPASAGPFSVISHTGQTLPALTADAKGLTVHLTDAPQYLIPESPNDLLRLAAAWQSLPLEIKTSAPGSAIVKTTLSNPTTRTVHVKASTGQELDLPAGQSASFALTVPVLRSQVHRVFRMELELDGTKLAQETRIAVINSLNVHLFPLGEQTVMARIENPSLSAFSGTITFHATEGNQNVSGSAPLELAANQRETTVKVHMAEPLPLHPSLEATMQTTAGQTVADSTLWYDSRPAQGLGDGAYGIWPVKDQSFAPATAPEAPPTLRGPVMKLDYQFTGAVKVAATKPATTQDAAPVITLSISPRPKHEEVTAIQGKPKALMMWVYGDGVGNAVCARFADSTG
jgi:hypothetical protein